MINFKTLLMHEFLRIIHSLKFSTMSLFAVLVTILCVYVQIMDFHDRKITFDEELMKAEESLSNTKVYSYLNVPIVIEPNPLSIFCKGIDDKVGNKIDVSLTEVPQFKKTSEKKNSFLDIFLTFDLITLVQIIFSVITLFIVADTISGEREEGTLKLIFSSSVLKFEYFLTKFFSSLIVLAIPLTIIFIFTTMIILFQPFITLSTSHWLTIFFLYLACLIFISIYILIALIISSVSSSASTSVLFGLLIWIALVFIYPNITNYIVNSTVKIPTSDVIKKQIDQMREDIAKKVEDSFEPYNGPQSYTHYYGGEYGIPYFIGITQKPVFVMWEQRIKKAIPIILDGMEQIYRIKNDFKQQFINQEKTATVFVRLLPGFLLEESTTKISGTHYIYRDVRILNRAKLYRDELIEYLKSKDAFGLKFFSQMDTKDMHENKSDYTEEVRNKWGSYDGCPPLDLSDMPKFRFQNRSLIPAEIVIDLVLMLLINSVLFLMGSYLFSRSDLRVKLG